ncbi:hypothetical protein TPHA_0B00700 [Tetrapisispora phaffii CBS 4417]|uniref:Seipin n=1 Tax=Tetrapisispora phaffii (strain ATCC 24235 / CBS 4417 / NBRC 1672 / NRRL Y-8282 / UCD 70-5) TaxID=1071381 RepID=G8BQE5_TETPH|nr:hypothetical protein TPHA_0B00700 [Tetrapisispora phaffii CBS 4417]CCE61742.1 hypothetical protein TPHA_0B00700 [Tetrapisispora phaffii CBS 4417]
MLINVSKPFQILQWITYISIIVGVQLLIVLPISVLIFHDFYTRLIPPDSSQYVPVSTFEQYDELTYRHLITRVPIEKPLYSVEDNGLDQNLPLRDNILYKMDIDMKFFCLNENDLSRNNLEVLDFQVRVRNNYQKTKATSVIYRRKIPITCLNEHDSIVEDEIHKYGKNRLAMYQREWLNSIYVDDLIYIPSEIRQIQYHFVLPGQRLILQPESNIYMRMEFKQGIRNMMLRWKKLTYLIGITVFYIFITTLFFISTGSSFYYMKSQNFITPVADIKL